MAVLNQPAVLQGGEGAGHDFLPAIIVQDLLAQATWVGVQQAGQDFFFQVVIVVHVYLLMGVERLLASASY
jgi:hypothetical protein